MSDDVVAEIGKNAREVLRVAWSSFNGVRLLDVRVWVPPVLPDGEAKPTKKGLSLRPETWAELLPEIERALAAGGLSREGTEEA